MEFLRRFLIKFDKVKELGLSASISKNPIPLDKLFDPFSFLTGVLMQTSLIQKVP